MVSSGNNCGTKRNGKWEKLLEKYLQALPRQVETMSRALESEDMPRVEIEAHRIKGTAGTYGLVKIADMANQVEISTKSQGLEEIHKEIEKLAQLVQLRISEL